MELLKYFNKTQIAVEYYAQAKPEKNYTTEQARKQFNQDSKIDAKILKAIIKAATAAQLKLL